MKTHTLVFIVITALNAAACQQKTEVPSASGPKEPENASVVEAALVEPRADVYADFPLVADLSALSDEQKSMLVLLIEASQIMDDLFWRQAYGENYQEWLMRRWEGRRDEGRLDTPMQI